MIALIENGKLASDLEAEGFDLSNVGLVDPVPANLAASDDPRLSDARVPLAGSVTNASVAAGAGIEQSKLDLNGVIPPAWLGIGADQAAPGDEAEYLSNKNQPDGYAGLDGGGKIPAANLPGDVGTGTITSVGLALPGEFSVTGSPVTTSGTLSAAWVAVADLSWFGNKEGAPGAPQFYTDPLPDSLIPDLDADKVISGEFDPARLPVAVGLGPSHAPGAVPDPGDGSGGALATDYLARDMTYMAFPAIGPSYQPTIDDPVINASSNPTGDKTVTFTDVVPGVTFFYSLTSGSADFVEVPSVGYISLAPAATVWCYAARAGYTNSNVVDYTNPNP